MSTHNIQLNDKIEKKKTSLNICFLKLSDSKQRVRISHGKQAISVHAIEVRLLFALNIGTFLTLNHTCHKV